MSRHLRRLQRHNRLESGLIYPYRNGNTNRRGRNNDMANEFVTESEFRWVLGWIIGGAVAVLSMLSGLIGYMFKRLTILPCRKEMEALLDEVKEDKQRSHEHIMREITERQIMLHNENTRRLDRIEAKMDRATESIPQIISAAQADIYRKLAKLEGK